MQILAKDVKKLRDQTGISMMACKKALTEANGNIDEAKKLLKKQGEKLAEKKLSRDTQQGVVSSYIHNNSRVGAIIEVHCETDFVAKNKEFQKLCQELAIQVTGFSPLYISTKDIPEEDIKRQKELYKKEFSSQNLNGDRLEKAIESKLEKFKKENSLLSQPYFRDEKKTVEELIHASIAKLGENIQVKRFTRYQI